RKGVGDFALTHRVEGYWDRKDTELDLVALDEERRVIRFGSCKRRKELLLPDVAAQEGHVRRFLAAHKRFAAWRVERVAIAPVIAPDLRAELGARGVLAEDLNDLVEGLSP
ncbi:MAG: hypothetical protein KC635_14260, partial [Myxococcales bacterium]|nr:hypothetical protein [Myxococcales bacterium]